MVVLTSRLPPSGFPHLISQLYRGSWLMQSVMAIPSVTTSLMIDRTKEGVTLRGTPWNFTIGLGGIFFVKTTCDLNLGIPSQDHVILYWDAVLWHSHILRGRHPYVITTFNFPLLPLTPANSRFTQIKSSNRMIDSWLTQPYNVDPYYSLWLFDKTDMGVNGS